MQSSKETQQAQKTCKFFLKGSCSFGDRCYFFHPLTENKLMDYHQYKLELDYPEEFQIDNAELQRYNIQLDVPFQLQRNAGELILIRHGLSVYNYASSDFFYKTGYSFRDRQSKEAYQINANLIDADLHPYGVIMSETNAKYLKEINVAVVFVSPLARAIQTAYHLFKTHPNQMNIKFIILPELTEILSKVQDISDIRKQISRYGTIFDFSYMKSIFDQDLDFWQIQNLTSNEEKERIFKRYESQISEEEQSSRNSSMSIQQTILDIMDEKFPSAIEKTNHMYERAIKAQQIIQNYVLDNTIDTSTQKVVVVSHNALIQSFTASGISDDGYVQRGDSMINCQMKQVTLF